MNPPAPPLKASPHPSNSAHHFGSDDLIWDGLKLKLGSIRGCVLATVVPDMEWPGMWRVRWSGGLTDMVNPTRAKDAAISIALSELNAGGKHV
jgi:hypothetical protein